MSVRVTSKGQITIPKRVREALGIRSGTELEVLLEEGRAVLAPVLGGVDALYGSLNRYVPRGKRLSDEEMMEKVRIEVAHAATLEGRSGRHKRRS